MLLSAYFDKLSMRINIFPLTRLAALTTRSPRRGLFGVKVRVCSETQKQHYFEGRETYGGEQERIGAAGRRHRPGSDGAGQARHGMVRGQGRRQFRRDGRPRRRRLLRRPRRVHPRGDHGGRDGDRCGVVRRRRRAAMGRCAARAAARGRAVAPAQGPRPVRQSAPGDRARRHGRCLDAQARDRQGPRYPDPARAHLGCLFRPAQR